MIHRGLDKKGNWVEGFIVIHDGGTFIIPLDSCKSTACHFYQVKQKTVGKRSDWKDKDGKYIYEGDIISLVNSNGTPIKVTCEYGKVTRLLHSENGLNECELLGFYFKTSDNHKTYPIVNNYLGKTDFELFTIEGTIHDKK